ncbi:MAG: transposase [Nanoarchaeota archaeon]|nr:transposase [Nanoarchaeota archaeon]
MLVLLVLKQKLKCSFDTLVDDLETRPFVVQLLGLKRIPDSSTLKKFSKRLKAEILYYLLADCGNQVNKKKLKLAIDATGLHVEDGSFHYRKRLGLSSKTRKNVKLSACIDTQTQLVTAVKLRKSKAHDNKDFITLLRNQHKSNQLKS